MKPPCLMFAGLQLLVLSITAEARLYEFTTLAGRSGAGALDGTNTAARFGNPSGAAMDLAGTIYVADSSTHTIRRIALLGSGWVVTTIAGLAGQAGSADGTNSDARFYNPAGIAVDAATNLYVADAGNHTIRQLTPVGTNWAVTTIAGSPGQTIPYGADGLGPAARFFNPQGIGVDRFGNVYVADSGNNTIRKVVPTGLYTLVTTLAGWAGDFSLPGTGAGSMDGTNTTARFYNPAGIAVQNDSTLFVADNGNHTIRRLSVLGNDWVTTTLAGKPGRQGNTDGTNGAARFNFPAYVALDSSGNILVSEAGNHTIRRLTLIADDWAVSTLAGLHGVPGALDGAGAAARFNAPNGLAADGAGNVFVADYNNGTIRKLAPGAPDWVVTTIAGAPPTGFGQIYNVASDPGGNLYFPDYTLHCIWRLAPAPSGWVSTVIAGLPGVRGAADGMNGEARFYNPMGIAVDSATNLYVADYSNYTIRKVWPVGTNWVVTTLAGTPGNPFGSADGTNTAAQFRSPSAIAVDSAGRLFVADTSNNALRMMQQFGPDWVVTTIAGSKGIFGAGTADGTNLNARFAFPCGITVDSSNNLYVADSGSSLIRKVAPVGHDWVVTTIAGGPRLNGSADGPGELALFNSPHGIAADLAGNVFVADTYNHTVRKLIPVGTNWFVATIGGAPGIAGASDGVGPGATFYSPNGVHVDSSGNLFVADTSNHTLRLGLPVPYLEIAAFGSQVALSWPLFATNYLLETTSTLPPLGDWVPVPGVPAVFNSAFVLTNTPNPSNAFFRLRKR